MSEEYPQRQFMIFPITEIEKIDFTLVEETSAETLRLSVNGAKTFVKWDGDQPAFLDDVASKEGPYTYDEILAILATPEWSDPNPILE
jgi:hypothetical protein